MFPTHPLRLASISLLVCLFSSSVTSADDASRQGKRSNDDQAKAAQQWINDLSSKVQLTSEQKDQIREKLNANGQKISSTWQKFTAANAKAIALEATMYAALEDSMTEPQKQQFRENRKAERQRNNAGGQARSKTRQASGSNSSSVSGHDANAKSSPSTRGRKNAAANAKKQQSHRRTDDDASQTADQAKQDAAYVYVTETIIVPVQEMVSNVSMDPQQRQQCDQACQKFHSELYQAWRDVTRYHDQLVQLEAEKLRAVEGVLDEGQLQKLKTDRKNDQSS